MSHPLLARLASADPVERCAACVAAPDDPSAILLADALGDALGDPVPAVAEAAEEALVRIGRECGDVQPTLRRALHGDDRERRMRAAFAGARLAPPDLRQLPALVEALGAGDGDRRWRAARLLVEVGRRHGEVSTLIAGLCSGDPSPVVRRMAAHCLRRLAPEAPETADALLRATRDADLRVRRAGFAALGALRDPGAAVFARLVEALTGDADPATRRISTAALGALASATAGALPATAVAALQRVCAEAEDPDLRRGAERALALRERAGIEGS